MKLEAGLVRKMIHGVVLEADEGKKIAQALGTSGRALVPLRIYFKDALLKVEVALCTGKKLFDKCKRGI